MIEKIKSYFSKLPVFSLPDALVAAGASIIFAILMVGAVGPGQEQNNSPWPTDSQWSILTIGGEPITDFESRAECKDPSNGGTSPAHADDLGSQSLCHDEKKNKLLYNPGLNDQEFGNGLQPLATFSNTYSAATYYSDPDHDSNGCSNISDDMLYFRVRLAETPLFNNAASGLVNTYWWSTLDINGDDKVDFYVRVDGNKSNNGDDPSSTDNIQLLYENETGTPPDDDPTGEPNVVGNDYLNPLKNGYARAVITPDNETVGDQTEYFLDWRLPVTAFKNDAGVQLLCEGDPLVLTNYSTSENPNDPFQKDLIMALGTHSDVINTSPPEYAVTKTATDINGGALVVGDTVEYTVTASNLASNLSNFVFTDTIPAGGTYVTGSTEVTLGATGECTSSTHCAADYNESTRTITVTNDWLYSAGASSPLYDHIIMKFRVTFSELGAKSNQGYAVTRELPGKQLSDDPDVEGNDNPTIVVVVTPPLGADLKIEMDDGVTSVIPGNKVTYTITVTNLGPGDVTGATVTDSFPGSLSSITWTCDPSDGSSCTESGTGHIDDSAVDLSVNGTVTYTVTAFTNSTSIGKLINTATVSVPESMVDLIPDNNTDTDTDDYTPTDFGDAPDPLYPTLLVYDEAGNITTDGARHTIKAGTYLGSSIDAEPNGIPNPTATGDDLNVNDDEDGVIFDAINEYGVAVLTRGNNAKISVAASVAGKLDAWVDFNGDGDWLDEGEQIFSNKDLSAGANPPNQDAPPLSFAVPDVGTLSDTYDTYARFRYSTAGSPLPTGPATNGEVEDYKVTIVKAPDLSTSTKTDNVEDLEPPYLVSPLQTITYTVSVINTGGTKATEVTIDDTLDGNLENLNVLSMNSYCGAPDASTSTANPPVLHITNASIDVGTPCVITFTARVRAEAAGEASIPNTVTISASKEGGLGASKSSKTLTVASIPNLSTSTKTVGEDSNSEDYYNVSSPQLHIPYTITIKNTGNATGTGINVTDTLDSNLENLHDVTIGRNCGGAPPRANNSTSAALDISNISVETQWPCVISYKADVKSGLVIGTKINNEAVISAASEGGIGATKNSDTLTVGAEINLSGSYKVENEDSNGNKVVPGDTITYTISVVNSGTADSSELTVTDVIDSHFGAPTNFTYPGCGSADGEFAAPLLTFSNVIVAAGTTCSISYDVEIDNPLIHLDPDNVSILNSATISPANGAVNPLTADPLKLDVTPDLSTSEKTANLNNTTNTNEVDPGQIIPFTITVKNTGDGSATGVNVNDPLDVSLNNVDNISLSACGTSSDNQSTTNELILKNISVDPGIDCVIVFTAQVDSPIAGGTIIGNTATISAASEGGNGATPSIDPPFTVTSTPNLSNSTKTVIVSGSDNIVENDETVTYSIVIVNSGNAPATGVSVDDLLDSDLGNLDVEHITFSGCGDLKTTGSTPTELNISNVDVAVGTNCIITFTAQVTSSALGDAQIQNSATISPASEGGPGGNPVSEELDVQKNPILSTSTKVDSVDGTSVNPLQTYFYTITVKNTGNAPATGVDIHDQLNPYLEDLYVTDIEGCGTQGNDSVNNVTPNVLDIVNASIAVGTDCDITFKVRVKANAPGGTEIKNTASISDAEEKVGSGVPFLDSPDTLRVAGIPDLSTSTKTDSEDDNNVAPGQPITYTITIKNTGNAPATGVIVDDPLDGHLENLFTYQDSFSSCGESVDTTGTTGTKLHASNIEVATDTDCVITFTANVKSTAPTGATIANTVTISLAGGDGKGATTSSDLLGVNSDVVFSGSTKTENDSDNEVSPGNVVAYTIHIVNDGSANAPGITVTDIIDNVFGDPFNFSYEQCGSPTSNFAAPTLTFSGVQISAHSTCSISYLVRVDSPIINDDPDNMSIRNSATISPANGSGTLVATALTLDVTPNLTGSTLVDDDPDNFVTPGQTVNYTLTINNTGNGTATGVNVSDTLDTNFGSLSVLSLEGCGASSSNSSTPEPPVISIYSLIINPGTPCVIHFSAVVDSGAPDGTTLPGTMTVSPSREGGNGAVIIPEKLTVSLTPPAAQTSVAGGMRSLPYLKPPEESKDGQQCLAYNPNRKLVFSDLKGSDRLFVKTALLLKGTYQLATGDFIISGYGTTTQDTGTKMVMLKEEMSRLAWAKLLMISHCLKIYNAMELPAKTVNDNPMPDFVDLPLAHNGDEAHDWSVNVMYSAAYYEIINGTHDNKAEPNRQVYIPEGVKMIVRVGELVKGAESPMADHLVNPAIDRNSWYFEFYSKAAAEGIFSRLINASGIVHSSVVRGPTIYELLKTMLLRHIIVNGDELSIQEYISDQGRLG